ncbi:H-NS family nucleoid-associated regulatory protein [Paraburkholderia silvatlantica]|uniref:H-NS histone family protein n=1 Tax=Paraburkholderia silvatlantica TaxID=321895 RepID=UPI0037537464
MSSYKELLAQREKLEKQIEEAKAREYAEVLDEIKQKMADYGITLAELGGGGRAGVKAAKAASRSRASVAPKYRDPDSGSTWSGRGKPPRWIAGQDRDRFLIQK